MKDRYKKIAEEFNLSYGGWMVVGQDPEEKETPDHLDLFESSMDDFMLGHIGQEDSSDADLSSSDAPGGS